MNIVDITIDRVTDIRTEIRDEYNERLDADDTPEGPETEFYARTHRANLNTIDTNGDHVSLDANDENIALLADAQKAIKDAILNAGGTVTPDEWRFSRYAGCSCPCSPGFILNGASGKEQFSVGATVTFQD